MASAVEEMSSRSAAAIPFANAGGSAIRIPRQIHLNLISR